MANTLNLGNGNWATKEDSLLAYNSENGNYKPLPFDFTRASSATVVNKAGLIETVGGGEPRIDFSNDSKGALLLEPQRTNNLLQSNQFDTNWSTSNVSLTSGQGGIGGSSNAWLYTITDPTHHLSQNVSSATTNVFSIYAKANSADGIVLRLVGAPNNPYIFYSLLDGTYVGTGGGGGINPSSQPVVNMGNGWYRFQINATGLTQVYIYGGTSLGTFATNGSIYIQNAQVEQGSYATSYIPTQGSAVTRSADSSSQTPPSGIIGQTEGTLFIEYPNIDNTFAFIGLTEGNNSNRMIVYSSGDNILKAQFRQLGTIKLSSSSSVITGKVKCALSFSSTESVFYVNGTQIAVGTSSAWSSLNEITLNQANQIGAKVSEIKYYNTRLSNSELQALTTI